MMQPLLDTMKGRLSRARNERGNVDFPLLLMIGSMSAVVLGAMALVVPHLADQVIYGTCLALNSVMDSIDCAGLPH